MPSNLYPAHLQKASILLDHSLDWFTPTIRQISNRLIKAQDVSFKSPNFIQPNDIIRILGHVKVDTDLGQLFYLSYLSPLSVHSKTLRPTRTFSDDPITQFIPQNDKALIAVRYYDQAPRASRQIRIQQKNVKNGRILIRPCPRARAIHGPPTHFPQPTGYGHTLNIGLRPGTLCSRNGPRIVLIEP